MSTSQVQRLRDLHSRAKTPEARHMVRKEIHTLYRQTCPKRKIAPQRYTFRWDDIVLLIAVSVVIVAAIYRGITATTGHPSTTWLIVAIAGTVVAVGIGVRIFHKEGWLRRKN